MEIALGWPQAIVLAVSAQRIAELALARRNMRRLLAEGATEHGAGHYPALVLLHAAWLAALFTLAVRVEHWSLVAVFVLLQGLRVWVVVSLGRYWTTRVVSHPAWPLVTHGPYRWCAHPNYAVVAAEIVVLPAAFGLWWAAAGFGALNLCVLWWRLRVERVALAQRQ